MQTEYESMLILSGNICSELLSASLSFEIIQKNKTQPKANSFIGLPSVISRINPAVTAEGEKLKFLISYKPGYFSELEYASIVFSKEIQSCYEIRVQNETISSGETQFSAINIRLSEEGSEKLELEFVSKQSEELDKLIDLSDSLSGNIDEYEKKIDELNQIISSKIQIKSNNELEISRLNNEIENIRKTTEELENLKIQKEKLEKDIENREEILTKSKEYSDRLAVYGDIMEFYKNEDGCASAFDKINNITRELNEIRDYLDLVIRKRAEKADEINDELNI